MGHMATTEETLAQIRAAHPEAKGFRRLVTPMVDGTEVEVVVKYPAPEAAYRAFREKLLEPSAAEKSSANRILINAMVVHPAGAELTALIKDWPGIVDTWAGECGELAGAVRGTRQEKL